MIQLHRLNGKEFLLNCDQIKFVESTPDTVVTLVQDEKFMVKESPAEVIQKIIDYKKKWLWRPMEVKENSWT